MRQYNPTPMKLCSWQSYTHYSTNCYTAMEVPTLAVVNTTSNRDEIGENGIPDFIFMRRIEPRPHQANFFIIGFVG